LSRWHQHENRVSKTRFTFKTKTKKKLKGSRKRKPRNREENQRKRKPRNREESQKTTTRSSEKKEKKKKKKKKNPETVARRGDLGRARRPGSRAAWICRAATWSRAACVCRHSFFFFFFFFFSFFLHFLSAVSAFWVAFWVINILFFGGNRVLETRFLCGHHLDKAPHQRGTTHENRALETRFRGPKSSL